MKKPVIFLVSLVVLAGSALGLLYYQRAVADLPDDPNFEFPIEHLELSIILPKGGEEAIKNSIRLYQRKHPNVVINLEMLDRGNYHRLLNEQIKFGKPADIFALRNDYLPLFKGELGSIDTEVIDEEMLGHFDSQLTTELNDDRGQLGIPLSSGSLVLFVNKDILDKHKAGIPKTWDEVAELTTKLTLRDGRNIKKSTIALGTSNNIDRAADVLALLMLQNGSLITSASKDRALFAEPETPSYFPGTEALRFFIAFSNPDKDIYSWSPAQDRSSAEFTAGNLAMMIGGPDEMYEITRLSPKFNFVTALVPQVKDGKQLSVRSFWNIHTSIRSERSKVAWDFVRFIMNDKNYGRYIDEAMLPSAKNTVRNDSGRLSAFAESLALSQSFYKGDPDAFEVIMRRLIARAYEGENLQKAINDEAANFTGVLKALELTN